LLGPRFRPHNRQLRFDASVDSTPNRARIPTVKDRVVLLMPIWEADFHPRSYGFRPKRRAHQAIVEIQKAVQKRYAEIIDADLSKCLTRYRMGN